MATAARNALAERLVIVTGKGGVGKSTVAGALGVAAVGRGLRTIVVELAGRSDVARVLGGEAADRLREIELDPGLHHVTIDRQPALEEYLREELPGSLPAAILARSRLFGLFVDATPGMDELLMIGKVWELTQRPRHKRGARPYDLVVLDGPATGQALALLAARGRSARLRVLARWHDRGPPSTTC
jgi:anion-transporting  ArsA/GET3 family ATPase